MCSVFFFKQKTAYEMRISDWSSDVCSSDLVLYDAHSIRSHVPRLFDGELPQFNIGTNGGATAAPELESVVASICAASGHSHVVNGRFKGGWTARHYGRPESGIHAIQMELAQRGYMADRKSTRLNSSH